MREVIREDILAVLTKLDNVLESKDPQDIVQVKELSNQTIHNSSIFQDKDSVSIAVIIYSLYKILLRGVDKKKYTLFRRDVQQALKCLKKGDQRGYEKNLQQLMRGITAIDKKIGLYVAKIIHQAQIKKGSKIYDHGISLAQSASVLGISQWELMNYVGKTKIIERGGQGFSPVARIKVARKLLK